MKKIFLVMFFIGFLNAADNDLYDNSVALHAGYGSMVSDSKTYTGSIFALQVNRNLHISEGVWNIDALQFVIEYANLGTKERDKALKVGANVMWYLENMSVWTPFAKVGLGAQYISGTESIDTGNIFFGTVGMGAEYQLRGDTALVGEVVDHLSFSGENSLKLSVGIKYSFGQSY